MEEDIERETSSDDYLVRENLWDEQWPEDDRTGGHPPEEPDNLDEELGFPDVVGTTDVIESVRDQEPYSPPTDPPVLPGGPEGVHIATGFGQSPEEEAQEDMLPRGDEDIRDEVVRILQEDSETSTMPLEVEVNRGVVRIFGPVPSAMDGDRAADLVSYVRGVVDVVDDTTVMPTA